MNCQSIVSELLHQYGKPSFHLLTMGAVILKRSLDLTLIPCSILGLWCPRAALLIATTAAVIVRYIPPVSKPWYMGIRSRR